MYNLKSDGISRKNRYLDVNQPYSVKGGTNIKATGPAPATNAIYPEYSQTYFNESQYQIGIITPSKIIIETTRAKACRDNQRLVINVRYRYSGNDQLNMILAQALPDEADQQKVRDIINQIANVDNNPQFYLRYDLLDLWFVIDDLELYMHQDNGVWIDHLGIQIYNAALNKRPVYYLDQLEKQVGFNPGNIEDESKDSSQNNVGSVFYHYSTDVADSPPIFIPSLGKFHRIKPTYSKIREPGLYVRMHGNLRLAGREEDHQEFIPVSDFAKHGIFHTLEEGLQVFNCKDKKTSEQLKTFIEHSSLTPDELNKLLINAEVEKLAQIKFEQMKKERETAFDQIMDVGIDVGNFTFTFRLLAQLVNAFVSKVLPLSQKAGGFIK